MDFHVTSQRTTENGGPEIGRPKINKEWKMAHLKMADQEIET